jgi:hypothetical protein
MQLNDIANVIVASATFLTALGAFVTSLINARRITHVANNVQTIEKATNSMKDALVDATAKASLAEGRAAGLQQGRNERGNE